MRQRIVPDIVSNQELTILSADVSVREATRIMAERGISAVMISDEEGLIGIFTERDLIRRVVAPGVDPDSIRLGEAMSTRPLTLHPKDSASEALQRMRANGVRHLPVVDGDKIVGMVSIRDLFAAVLDATADNLRQKDMLLFDTGYGIG